MSGTEEGSYVNADELFCVEAEARGSLEASNTSSPFTFLKNVKRRTMKYPSAQHLKMNGERQQF